MTIATCIYCGSEKFGAFVPCEECKRSPTERDDVVRSLALTDHHFTRQELSNFGSQIKSGSPLTIDAELEHLLSSQIDDAALANLARLADPAYREYRGKRERNILLAIIATMIGGIAWMLYRFTID